MGDLVNHAARTLWLAAALLGGPGAIPAIPPAIPEDADSFPLDREVSRSMPTLDGRAIREVLSLSIEVPGTYSVSVTSYDFRPILSVFTAEEDRLGRAATDNEVAGARLELELTPGRYTLEIESKAGVAGEYRLLVNSGPFPALSAAEEIGMAIDYYREAAGRAEQRADFGKAAEYRLRLGVALCEERGDHAAARSELERALALNPSNGPDNVRAQACAYLGTCLIELGLVEQAIECLSECRPPDKPDNLELRFFIADNLGRAHSKLGQLEAAYAAHERCLALSEDHGRRDLAAIAQSRMATAREGQGEIDGARELYEQALGLIEDPRARSAVHEVCLPAGYFFEERGEFDRARRCFQDALASASRWSQSAAARAQLATLDMSQGRLSAARQVFYMLQRERQEHGRQDPRFDRNLRKVLANIASRLGQLHVALELRLEILAEVEESPDRRLLIDALNDLATVRELSGSSDEADRLYRRSIQLAETLGDAGREARGRLNLSRLLRRAKAHDSAKPMLKTALELARNQQNRRIEAFVLEELSLCDFELGRLERAGQRARRALEIHSELAGADHLLLPLRTLARIALRQDDTERAAELLNEADRTFASGDFSVLRGLEAAGLRSRYHKWGQVAADLTALRFRRAPPEARSKIVSEGFARAQTWKGRALLEGLHQQQTEPAEEADPRPLERELGEQLGGDRILIEYVAGDERLYAFVVQAGRLEFLELGDRETLEQDVQRYLDGINGGGGRVGAAEILARAGPLYRRLLEPVLAGREPAPGSLVIVPSAGLAGLPFEALVIRSRAEPDRPIRLSDLEFVVDRFDVSYGPSSAVLAELARRPSSRPSERLLLMGDPLYTSEQLSDLPDSSRFSRLEKTRNELKEVSTQLLLDDGERSAAFGNPLQRALRERSAALETPLFDLYLGGAATLAPLERGSGAYRIIHLAAHGLVDAENPGNTGIVLAADERWNGLLGLDDVVAFGLDADLVVLSACSTARGRVLRGEGTQSMAYAFLLARSRAVIASLYDVADREAAEVMTEFYLRHLGQGLPIAQALQLAKQKLRRSKAFRGSRPETTEDLELSSSAHPFYWAPFIYIGELEPPR